MVLYSEENRNIFLVLLLPKQVVMGMRSITMIQEKELLLNLSTIQNYILVV